MPTTATTCIWFDGPIDEAADFYVSVVPDSGIRSRMDWLDGDRKGRPLVIDLTIAGTPYQLLNGGPEFPLSEVVSICLEVDDQAEVDRLWDALVEGGGQHSQCGWLSDRFGLSWQLVPRRYNELLLSTDAVTQKRLFDAMLTMSKLEMPVFEEIVAGR